MLLNNIAITNFSRLGKKCSNCLWTEPWRCWRVSPFTQGTIWVKLSSRFHASMAIFHGGKHSITYNKSLLNNYCMQSSGPSVIIFSTRSKFVLEGCYHTAELWKRHDTWHFKSEDIKAIEFINNSENPTTDRMIKCNHFKTLRYPNKTIQKF
jgi:hypothetical protein